MVLRIQNLHRLSKTIKRFVLLAAFSALPVSGSAAQPDSAAASLPPTHRQFVDSCLGELAANLLSRFTPNRTEPIAIVSDTASESSGNFVSHLTGVLSDRGLLIRNPTPEHPDSGIWSLRYTLAPVELTLTEPQRRAFLGRIWVRRTLYAGLAITIHDEIAGEDIWTDSADSTYSDWVAKRDLAKLEDAALSPQAPLTGWEKAKTPLIIGGIGIVTGLVLLTAW